MAAQSHREMHDLDGQGEKRCTVYNMRPVQDFWAAVTDVLCPVCRNGTVRWAEAGYVPGYRICDSCKRHFLARGKAAIPMLIRVGRRRG